MGDVATCPSREFKEAESKEGTSLHFEIYIANYGNLKISKWLYIHILKPYL